jgi:hypothetical protein
VLLGFVEECFSLANLAATDEESRMSQVLGATGEDAAMHQVFDFSGSDATVADDFLCTSIVRDDSIKQAGMIIDVELN